MAAEDKPVAKDPEAVGGSPVARKPPPPRRPLPSPLAVITASFGLFLIVLTLLAIQVRNGRDPALGPGPVVPSRTQAQGGKTQGQTQGKSTATTQATKIVSRTSPVPP